MLDNFCKEQIAVGHARGPAFDLEEIMFHLDRFVMNDATAQVTEAIADSPDLLRKALNESSGWCKCRDGWQIVDEYRRLLHLYGGGGACRVYPSAV